MHLKCQNPIVFVPVLNLSVNVAIDKIVRLPEKELELRLINIYTAD